MQFWATIDQTATIVDTDVDNVVLQNDLYLERSVERIHAVDRFIPQL